MKFFISLRALCITTMLLSGMEFASANNAIYIATSNEVAKRIQLEIVSNNAANTNTPGYEQDAVVFKSINHKESKNKNDSFVVPQGNYRTGDQGSLKTTGKPLDMAIVKQGYFMVLTPRGPRYTLAGAGTLDNTNALVTAEGHAFASVDGQPILFPEPDRYTVISILHDGTVYADEQEIGVIGVYDFPPGTELMKEGSSLYSSSRPGFVMDTDDVTIATGVLRASNVNSTKVLTEMIELQRSCDVKVVYVIV